MQPARVGKRRDGNSTSPGPFDSLAVVGAIAEARRENARLAQQLASVEAERRALKAAVSTMDNRLRLLEARISR